MTTDQIINACVKYANEVLAPVSTFTERCVIASAPILYSTKKDSVITSIKKNKFLKASDLFDSKGNVDFDTLKETVLAIYNMNAVDDIWVTPGFPLKIGDSVATELFKGIKVTPEMVEGLFEYIQAENV